MSSETSCLHSTVFELSAPVDSQSISQDILRLLGRVFVIFPDVSQESTRMSTDIIYPLSIKTSNKLGKKLPKAWDAVTNSRLLLQWVFRLFKLMLEKIFSFRAAWPEKKKISIGRKIFFFRFFLLNSFCEYTRYNSFSNTFVLGILLLEIIRVGVFFMIGTTYLNTLPCSHFRMNSGSLFILNECFTSISRFSH